MPCFIRLSISLSQSVFSKLKPHSKKYCKLVLFNVCIGYKTRKKKAYFTVTDFAKFLGISGLYSFSKAM
jgi:hypothetical protein